MIRAFSLTVAFVLVGCAHQPATLPAAPLPPETPPKPVVRTIVKQTCIHWDKWSDAEMTALHDALVSVTDGSPIIKAAREFHRYYDAAKACADAQK